MKLIDRMRDYLKRQDDWVLIFELRKRAKQANYSDTHVNKAIQELHACVDVGVLQVSATDHNAKLPAGTYARLYEMSEEEKQQRREVLDFFEQY
jgi:hypothetical protein